MGSVVKHTPETNHTDYQVSQTLKDLLTYMNITDEEYVELIIKEYHRGRLYIEDIKRFKNGYIKNYMKLLTKLVN